MRVDDGSKQSQQSMGRDEFKKVFKECLIEVTCANVTSFVVCNFPIYLQEIFFLQMIQMLVRLVIN